MSEDKINCKSLSFNNSTSQNKTISSNQKTIEFNQKASLGIKDFTVSSDLMSSIYSSNKNMNIIENKSNHEVADYFLKDNSKYLANISESNFNGIGKRKENVFEDDENVSRTKEKYKYKKYLKNRNKEREYKNNYYSDGCIYNLHNSYYKNNNISVKRNKSCIELSLNYINKEKLKVTNKILNNKTFVINAFHNKSINSTLSNDKDIHHLRNWIYNIIKSNNQSIESLPLNILSSSSLSINQDKVIDGKDIKITHKNEEYINFIYQLNFKPEEFSIQENIITGLNIISCLNNSLIEEMYISIKPNIITLIKVQNGGFIVQGLMLMSCINIKLDIIESILNNFNSLISNKYSSYAIYNIIESNIPILCEDKIIKHIIHNKSEIISNTKSIRLLESIIKSFKSELLKMIYSIIEQNFLYFLNIRPGYFLLRRIVREKKDDKVQFIIINTIIRNLEEVVNSTNGSLLCQSIIRNYCIKLKMNMNVDVNNEEYNSRLSMDRLFEKVNKQFEKQHKSFEKKENSNEETDENINIDNNYKENYENDYFQNPFLGLFFDCLIETVLIKKTDLTKLSYKIFETAIIYGKEYFHDKVLSFLFKNKEIVVYLMKSIRGAKLLFQIIDKYDSIRKSMIYNLIHDMYQELSDDKKNEDNMKIKRFFENFSLLYKNHILINEIEEFNIPQKKTNKQYHKDKDKDKNKAKDLNKYNKNKEKGNEKKDDIDKDNYINYKIDNNKFDNDNKISKYI